ncbi:YeeE/YedE thiosulfate transporter family protein [Pseudomonas boanensis]|uniref:YeeE/YedE thiosulfate transporter family protein n=1 Tax=Metapseudomonas boanensis TaxID=2822138 RepID=UPI0035D3DBB0
MILAASIALALLMGFAIQRGSTCMVAAMEELIQKHSWSRASALLETSLWVVGGFVLLRAFDLLPQVPMGRPLHWHAAVGGALLGLGAFVNGGCAFGVVARIGSGQWAWLATPIGFLLGFAIIARWMGAAPDMPVQLPTWLLDAPAALIAAVMAARIAWLLWRQLSNWGSQDQRAGSAHLATLVIGMTFLLLFVCVGAWAYTDILAELATGHFMVLGLRGLLLPALFAGALYGGWSAGRWQHQRPSLGLVMRCLCGGLLMGVGAVLVPGGNDSLVLFGLPLLWPNAWLAIVTMCAVVALAIRFHR